uniref:Protein kinase domain-containing protein n=1 Tax=Ascaris lumbricoides TaxID=6252 RepID=A0A9J2Q7K6_ASCLU
MDEIEEIPYNLCGVIAGRYVIKGPVDDPVGKGFLQYHIHDDDLGADKTADIYMIMARRPLDSCVHRTITVLEKVQSRSVHFPILIKTGKFKELVYGCEGEQDVERDPEWGGRAFAIIQALPVELALMIGIGCVRALAALHRAGFIHRFVSPFSFSFTNPPTVDNFLGRMLITDLSLVLPWPVRPRRRVAFVGSLRYSSARVHYGREQGPSDDIISVIYIVAEFIHGKLPWRSVVYDDQMVSDMKTSFYTSIQFQKLPHELRQVYKTMYRTPGPSPVDHITIIKQFMSALERRDPMKNFQLPDWLLLE